MGLSNKSNVCITNKSFFLGSIILKQQPTTSDSQVGDKRTVIDGQQRLTTINIFLKVLCLKTSNSSFERMFKLFNNEIALIHNRNDIEAFERIIKLDQLEDINEKDSISLCYNYFKENIDIDALDINKILSRILFVGIDLDENEDEQQIFDTINSLGVKLSTADLLKNYFFKKDNISMYNSYWRDLFEADDEVIEYWETEITTGRI